jgi:hypothetical protein
MAGSSFHKVGRTHYVSVADLEHYQATKRQGGRKRKGSKSAQRLKRGGSHDPIPQQIARWLTNHPTEAGEIRNASELHLRMQRSGLDLPRSSVYRCFDSLTLPIPQLPPPPPIPEGLLPVAALAAELEISKKVIEIWHQKGLITGQRYDGVLYVTEASVQAFLRGDMPEIERD